MTNKAWIESDVIRDIALGDPYTIYNPEVAVHYDTDVPDGAENGDTFKNGVLTKRPVPPPPPPAPPLPFVPPTVSVIEYKMLFTSAERIATKAAALADPVMEDLTDLMNDPRTTSVNLALDSIQNALLYMTAIGILAPGRKDEISTGVVI